MGGAVHVSCCIGQLDMILSSMHRVMVAIGPHTRPCASQRLTAFPAAQETLPPTHRTASIPPLLTHNNLCTGRWRVQARSPRRRARQALLPVWCHDVRAGLSAQPTAGSACSEWKERQKPCQALALIRSVDTRISFCFGCVWGQTFHRWRRSVVLPLVWRRRERGWLCSLSCLAVTV
jgi:hypothetical protein